MLWEVAPWPFLHFRINGWQKLFVFWIISNYERCFLVALLVFYRTYCCTDFIPELFRLRRKQLKKYKCLPFIHLLNLKYMHAFRS